MAWALQLADASGVREMVKVGLGAGRGGMVGAGEGVGGGAVRAAIRCEGGHLLRSYKGLLVPAMSFPDPCLLSLFLLWNQCQ